MCGRFTLVLLSDYTNLFPWIAPPDTQVPPRYNIAPSQYVAAAANTTLPRIDFFRWGLIPSWAKDPSIGARMINARAETLADKPAYRAALRRRRCLIPAHGFYEWRKEADGSKTPMYITLKSGRPFSMAGLWEVWHAPDGSAVASCAVITTTPNELMKPIHDRMPAIIGEGEARAWLAPEELGPEELLPLLGPYASDQMTAWPVSRAVNSPKHDGPDCIAAVEELPAAVPQKRKRGRPDDDAPRLF